MTLPGFNGGRLDWLDPLCAFPWSLTSVISCFPVVPCAMKMDKSAKRPCNSNRGRHGGSETRAGPGYDRKNGRERPGGNLTHRANGEMGRIHFQIKFSSIQRSPEKCIRPFFGLWFRPATGITGHQEPVSRLMYARNRPIRYELGAVSL